MMGWQLQCRAGVGGGGAEVACEKRAERDEL